MPPVPSEGGEISPLRFASVEMTRGALANIVISSGDACRYGADGKRFDETLSREISQRNAARTIRGDFSTPLRYGRNDDRARLFFIKSAPEGRHHHPRPEGLSPPERKRRNPSTQPAAPAAPPSFIICARRAPPQPSACKAVKLKNPWAVGPSILRTLIHYFVFTIMTKAILPSLYSTVRGMERREESSRAMERPMP